MTDYVTGDIFTRTFQNKTLKAWGPFDDCVSILFDFQTRDIVDEDEELPEWRHSWVAGITLLRAVGHVMDKVDGDRSARHREVISSWWNTLKSDRSSSSIFWDFIEQERNTLLKTYTFGARIAHDDNGYFVELGDGSDAFEKFRQAVYWWREQLVFIESRIT